MVVLLRGSLTSCHELSLHLCLSRPLLVAPHFLAQKIKFHVVQVNRFSVFGEDNDMHIRNWTQLRVVLFALVAACLLATAVPRLHAQNANGSINGTVTDTTGAVIPNAKIELTNDASGITRTSVSNGVGYFNIVAIPPGTYSVRVSAKDFSSWEVKGIVFYAGENHALPKIALQPGISSEVVEVTAEVASMPLDTSESRQTLGQNMIADMNIQGRNASELIKVMPGMGMNTGLTNSAWTSLDTSTGKGIIGQYSAGGAPPSGGVSLSTDGAAIVDIGSSNTQVSNINQDQTAEITIIQGSFGAESAKGPVSIQAISKSGSSQFHGSAYTYTRGGTFNAEDSQLKVNGVSKPNDHYWYPGFNIGGPIVIPGLGYTRKHDKLFFFVGYEYMMQHPAGAFRESDVPTDAMLTGDFSNVSSLAGYAGITPCATSSMSSWPYSQSGSFCAAQTTAGRTQGTGVFNNFSSIKDTNGAAYVAMMRAMGTKPNQDPATHNGYNYGILDHTPLNRWEARGKLDWSINDSTKLSGVYTEQREKDLYPFGLYWWPGGGVPYPTSSSAEIISRTFNVSFTKSFSPTLTNDLTFAMSYFTLPMKPDKPAAMTPDTTGIGISVPVSLNSIGLMPQIPNILSWGCNTTGQLYGCFPQLYAYGYEKSFQGGAVGNIKKVPSLSENISKTWRKHTFKGGFYWELDNQVQSDLSTNSQGSYEFDPWSVATTGNMLADLLVGGVDSFSQTAGEPLEYVRRYIWATYFSDSWKVNRFTINYGVRLEHNGQWFANNGNGLAVWSDASYVNNPSTASSTSGVLWHGSMKSVPLSGWRSKLLDFSPRLGVAWDLFGTGKTVVRGGFGTYRWQVSDGDASGSYVDGLGIGTVNSSGFVGMSSVSSLSLAAGSLLGGDVNVLRAGDALTPYTNNWNLIISQAAPWHSSLEIQYQGSHTGNAVVSNNNNSQSSLANYNKIPKGTLLSSAACIANSKNCGAGVSNSSYTSSPSVTDQMYYRPYKDYLQVTIADHGSYSNYNAFVLQWQKQKGPVNWVINYTFGKVLGILDGNTTNGNGNGNIVDPFNIDKNYGVLAYDHTQIFNASYVVHVPSLVRNPLLGQVTNGWVVSGITQAQSGPPLQSNSNRMNFSSAVGIADVLGTPDAISMPRLTCNPKSNLKSGQYFNPACFAPPIAGTPATSSTQAVLGTNGPNQWPYLRGPAFVSSDLAIFKDFKVRNRHTIEFRASAFNFLNHKLKQFGTGNDVQMIMSASSTSSTGFTLPTGFNGKPAGITGRRVMECALKYSF